ncbi:hypothetical protein FRX31_031341 [Thalictrum thalictroides]|uniref:Uncharacterized protein n=1 Tax=Thalictrum thalictroides TaxID=46969 RepID=A0A7J6V2G3_THATH|nr:hypothetical protein FRX31_031341 [Thalictrum thalictroides]
MVSKLESIGSAIESSIMNNTMFAHYIKDHNTVETLPSSYTFLVIYGSSCKYGNNLRNIKDNMQTAD